MTKDWYLSTSDDYLSGFENEEFTLNATSAFEEVLLNSPESYLIEINDSPSLAIVQDLDNRTLKNLLTRLDSVRRGDLISYKNHKWLIIEHVDDNKMYQSCEIKLCNNTFTLQEAGTKEVEAGRNKYGQPIYETIVTPEVSLPCIVDTTVSTSGDSEPIRLPENQLNITIPFTNHENLKLNHEFMMYETKYKVIGFDKTHSINGIGLLIIKAERV